MGKYIFEELSYLPELADRDINETIHDGALAMIMDRFEQQHMADFKSFFSFPSPSGAVVVYAIFKRRGM